MCLQGTHEALGRNVPLAAVPSVVETIVAPGGTKVELGSCPVFTILALPVTGKRPCGQGSDRLTSVKAVTCPSVLIPIAKDTSGSLP